MEEAQEAESDGLKIAQPGIGGQRQDAKTHRVSIKTNEKAKTIIIII
jgi:hypothetical protein